MMEATNQTRLAFRPASRADLSERAKVVALWLDVPHTQALGFLATLYGYPDLRAMQADADRAEAGDPLSPPGPYRRDGDGDASAHIEATLKRFLGLGVASSLVKPTALMKVGLYQEPAQFRRGRKHAAEMHALTSEHFGKRFANLAAQPVRKSRPPKAKIFHEFEVSGRRFYGVASGDLYVYDEFGHPAYLGPSRLYFIDQAPSHSPRYKGPGWYICKYDRWQISTPLEGLSRSEAEAVAREFGIEIPGIDLSGRFRPPTAWPCVEGLATWANRHRITAKRMGMKSDYLKNWHEWVLE